MTPSVKTPEGTIPNWEQLPAPRVSCLLELRSLCSIALRRRDWFPQPCCSLLVWPPVPWPRAFTALQLPVDTGDCSKGSSSPVGMGFCSMSCSTNNHSSYPPTSCHLGICAEGHQKAGLHTVPTAGTVRSGHATDRTSRRAPLPSGRLRCTPTLVSL